MSALTREQVERLLGRVKDESLAYDLDAHDASQRETIQGLEQDVILQREELTRVKTSHDNLFALLTARNADLAAMTQERDRLQNVLDNVRPEYNDAQRRIAQLEEALKRLWATRKYQWSNNGGESYALTFYGNPSDIEHALEGK